MTISMTTTGQGRIAIVDDHELLLDGLTTWVRSNAGDLTVVVSVTGWFDLIRDPEFPPEVTIMDFQLKEPISIESRIRTCLAAGSQVVVVSALETDEVRERVLAAGAAAFVAKSRPANEVVDAVREALVGGAKAEALGSDRAAGGLPFSEEVLEALRLYASGNSPVDIALTMNLPFESVKGYIATVREHYAAAGRAAASKQELIRRAAEDGYLL
jgi:DNA-binding NarL/FixJ family response regulator